MSFALSFWEGLGRKAQIEMMAAGLTCGDGEPRICELCARSGKWKAVEWLAQMRIGCTERALASLDWLTAWRGRSRELPAHLLTGVEGEEAAYFYLRRKGYTVVARRWTAGNVAGDLDLIGWQGPMLCFFEVKTRTAHDIAPAESAVDGHKRSVLRRLARHYVRQLPMEARPPVRFDVVSVYLVADREAEFTHFENAFGWDERRRMD
jgi:putative endonuclease